MRFPGIKFTIDCRGDGGQDLVLAWYVGRVCAVPWSLSSSASHKGLGSPWRCGAPDLGGDLLLAEGSGACAAGGRGWARAVATLSLCVRGPLGGEVEESWLLAL